MAVRSARRRAAPSGAVLGLAAADPPPRHAIAAEWIDPDDDRPNAARAARRIRGWRTFCPLRRLAGSPSSGITTAHILAADKFRELADVAAYGFSPERPLIYVGQSTMPRWGMTPAALAQTKAMRALARAVMLFAPGELVLVQAVLLRNMSLRAWAATQPGRNPMAEKVRLIGLLDRLAEHFDAEIADDIARGRRLIP